MNKITGNSKFQRSMYKLGNVPKDIATTSKAEFLKDGYKTRGYTRIYLTYKNFISVFKKFLSKCKTCQVYYWENCRKRCNCD